VLQTYILVLQEPNQNPVDQHPANEKVYLYFNIKKIAENYGFKTGTSNSRDALIMHQYGATMPLEVSLQAIRPVGVLFCLGQGLRLWTIRVINRLPVYMKGHRTGAEYRLTPGIQYPRTENMRTTLDIFQGQL